VWVDAVLLLDVAEVGAQRLLFVGPVDSLSELSAEDTSALVRVELQRRPRQTVVDALVDRHRVVGSAGSAELQTNIRHLHRLHLSCNL